MTDHLILNIFDNFSLHLMLLKCLSGKVLANKDRERHERHLALKNHSCSGNDFLLFPLNESHFLLLLTDWLADWLTGHCLTLGSSCTDRRQE